MKVETQERDTSMYVISKGENTSEAMMKTINHMLKEIWWMTLT